MPTRTVAELATLSGGRLIGDGSIPISGVAPLESADPGELSFVANARYLPYLQGTRAGAVLVPDALAESVPGGMTHIVVSDPHVALYRILPVLFPPSRPAPGVHPTAVVDATVAVGAEVSVAPYVVVEAGAVIGDRCVIGAHAVIGAGARIGADSVVHAHATVYPGVVIGERCIVHSGARVGKPGFGFVWLDGGHRRVEQVGGCVLEDEVEIGCNCTVDRGSVSDTVVGAGTKLDNLVHLGHNVQIGAHSLLIAQVGIAGSTAVGEGAILAGQVGVAGHLSIGAGARLGARAAALSDVPAGETYTGYPARPHREFLRAQAAIQKLPELLRRVRDLEKAVLNEQDRATTRTDSNRPDRG